MSGLNTFLCEYHILPDYNTREICMTFFGGMTVEDDKKELGDVNLMGRWACVGEAKGYCVVQAKNNFVVQKWLNNWVTMADIKVTPCLDDNEQRHLLLKREPDFRVGYNHVNDESNPGESLYLIRYKFKENCKEQGFHAFANMTEEQDKLDSGKCTSLGRWHVPSKGTGFAIVSSPSIFDLYKWAYNWNDLCDVDIQPVTKDHETRKVIQEKMGFKKKHENLMNEIQKLE